MGNEALLKEIGIRIRSRRKELLMTQEDIAEQMDVSIQMISNLELGKKAIRPENIVKICKILNVSSDFVLMGVSSQYESNDLAQKLSSLPNETCKALETIIDKLTEKQKLLINLTFRSNYLSAINI